jgi:capsular exopolysaccharide synthesis family protein
MERYTALSKEMTQVKSQRLALGAQVDIARKGAYQSLSVAVQDPLIQKLKEDVAELSSQYAGMRNRFYDKYPSLADLKAKLDESKERLDAETKNVVRSLFSDYESQLVREQELQSQFEELQSEIMALNDASLQDAALTREAKSNQELYESMFERLKEIGVSAEVPTTNVSVIDKAQAPTHHTSPRIKLCLVLSGFFGLFLGGGLVSLLDYLDDRIETPEAVERYLGIPSLGVVPDFARLEASSLSFNRDDASRIINESSAVAVCRSLYATLGRCFDAVFVRSKGGFVSLAREASSSRELVVIDPLLGAAAEAYRTIRTGLMFSRAGSPPKTILVVSALSGEGKTVTAINVALAFAQTGARTLLVDADLRGPRCHRVLAMGKTVGLSEVLVGQLEIEDAVSKTPIGNLFFLSGGSVPPNPTELLVSTRMREVMGRLGHDFDYVIFDSFPVIPASDAVILSTMVDGALLVVGCDTPRQVVRQLCSRLAYVRAKILGAILNRSRDGFVADPYYCYEERTAGAPGAPVNL